tara:strand:+ start:76 stop:279 length:204 start_codon:yes stop_codon:yes gene_type:complete
MTKECPECLKMYESNTSIQKYCTPKCTNAVSYRARRKREELGIEFVRPKFVSELFFDWDEFPDGVIM